MASIDPQSPTAKSISSETPEPIFENVVAEKYPDAYQSSMEPEEVPSEITNAQDVDRPAAQVLEEVPVVHEDGHQKYFFIGAVVVIFIVVFFVLYFIFKKNTVTPQGPVTLAYWGLWEEETILKPVFEAYTKANPHVTITYAKQSPRDYISFVKGRSKSGKGPDIYRYHNTWLPQLLNDGKYLQSIPSSIMSSAEFDKTFHQIHQQDLRVGSDYYGIPFYVDNLLLIYNPDILKAGGIAGAPTQWLGDLPGVVEKTTVKDAANKPITSGIALGTANNIEHFSDIYALLLLLNSLTAQKDLSNTWALSVLKSVGSGSGAGLASEALQVYRDFAEQRIWTEDMPNSIDAFAQGKVGMIFAYAWQIPIIKAKNPDIKLAVAPIPEGLQEKKLTIASYWVEGVSPYSKNQLEAWKLLKYMSQADSLEKIYAGQAKTRGLGMAYSRVDMKSKIATDPILSVVLEQLDFSVSVPVVTRTFDKGLNDEMVTYIEKAITSAAGGAAYSSAISGAATGIQQVLTKYQIK